MAATKATPIASRLPTEGMGEMKDELARFDKEVRAFVQERPVLALLSAVAAGYLVGRMMRRYA